MLFSWQFYIHAGIIASALVLGTLLRAKLRFFQRFLIPVPIISGFILLPFYNYLLPLIGIGQEYLGEIAYHLLSISFISLAMRPTVKSPGRTRNRLGLSMMIIGQYGFQAMFGLLLTLLFMGTFMPGLFHSFGFLFPLGFALGPGQAYAIGEGWRVFGIEDAGNVGLTFAAIGFIMASFGGIFLIHHGVKKHWISPDYMKSIRGEDVRTGVFPRGSRLQPGSYQTTQTEAIDSLTANVIFVLVTYLLTYLFLNGISYLLAFIGPTGVELATNLWGISFIFAAMMAMLVRALLERFNADHILDARTLSRVSGISVDIMVTSSIAAISLVVAMKYIIPILIITGLGTLIILTVVPWMGSRLFTDHRFLRSLIIFGVSTGTLTTGLALLRVLDPEFETPVASDYTYASAVTFAVAIPFILAINFPAKAFQTGDMRWLAAAFAVLGAYMLASLLWYRALGRERAFQNPGTIWLKNGE
ncbi:sodium:glutamate symporter [Salinispira pacifica]|uniref:Sodium/glutamate symporter n=1 Tax=Salinispira pacifica TaxID=1307761 RepID=V5WF37_9SPIO|nr:sodium:glutamate symporter [Salinispira pacifica]AHC14418.1 Sodium/glutamate symporter [Salinispira pacifica]